MPKTNERPLIKIDGVACELLSWDEHTDIITIPSLTPEGRPSWRYTDPEGHEHAPEVRTDAAGVEHVSGYPTLFDVMGEPAWCEMCEDTHEEWLGYACRKCGFKITPATMPARDFHIEGETKITFTALMLAQPDQGSLREYKVEVVGKHYLAYCVKTEYRMNEPVTSTFAVIKVEG